MTNPGSLSEDRRLLLEKLRRGEFQGSSGTLEPLIPRPSGAPAPLAPGHAELWLHDHAAAGAPIYNECFTIHKRGDMDPAVLERSFNEIVRRHEIWRSAFPMRDGKIVQQVDPGVRVPVPFTDLSHLPAEEREAQAVRIATADAARPFDLDAAPLFRVVLVRMAEDYHRIYLTAHRLVFDCESIYGVLIRELAALYDAYSRGQGSPLPPLACQYSDYAAWKQRQSAGSLCTGQVDYWRGILSGELPPVELPVDRPSKSTAAWHGGMEVFTIPMQRLGGLAELCQSEGVTPYVTLLATFQVLLYRYSGQDDIIIGGKTSTRTRPEFEPLIGSFLNTIVLRNHIAAGLSFRKFLGRVKGTVVDALTHSEIPFEDVVRELAPKRDAGRHPLFQVLFSTQASHDDFPDGWRVTDMEIFSGASGFDLFAEFSEHPAGLDGRFVYSADLFDRATIRRLQDDFLALLEALVANPDLAISRGPSRNAGGNLENPGGLAKPAQAYRRSIELDQVRAPGNSVERQLVEIWETLLARHPIGVNQDFFDLGGNSLLAASLLTQMEHTFGRKLYLPALLRAPTIKQLARVLQNSVSIKRNGITAIQPFGSRAAFFCLGAGPLFFPLADRLGSDRPFLSVNLEEADRKELGEDYTLEELAARFVAHIRNRQPKGPYYLGGWCLSGVLAYECARQLTRQGQEVDLVVLFDSPQPGFRAQEAQFVLSRSRFHLSVLWNRRFKDVPAYLLDRVKGIGEGILKIKARLPIAEPPARPSDEDLLAGYRPPAYAGRVALILPSIRPKDPNADWQLGWEKYQAGKIEAFIVPGDHGTMFHEPNVEAMADQIIGILDEIGNGTSDAVCSEAVK